MKPIDDDVFANAVRKVAPRSFDIWSKLLAGAYAERDLFERKCEELATELAELKQRKLDMTLALPLRLVDCQIIDANGVMIALVRGEMADYRERGAQIVAAVNTRDELLKAAKQVLKEYDGGWKSGVDQMFYLRAAIEKVEQA